MEDILSIHGLIGSGASGFFGDGSDGDLTTGITLTSTPNDLVIKQYKSFNLPTGQTLTVNNRCKGMIIYCQSDVIISGTINMTSYASEIGPGVLHLPMGKLLKIISHNGGNGGVGGNGGGGTSSSYRSAGGSAGSGRKNAGSFGGGGGGGGYGISRGSNGGSADAELCGSDVLISNTISSMTGGINGVNGNGALGYVSSATNLPDVGRCLGGGGGGSGALLGQSSYSQGVDGANAGGLIIIITKGDIIINSGGIIRANGGVGGAGSAAQTSGTPGGGGGGGGGAGGGVIALYYKGIYTNNGTIQVNGGSSTRPSQA
jgi:hypothetical protein